MNISERLKTYRYQSGLSQQEVADALELSKATYCRMEKGESLPDAAELDKLLKLYNVSYEEMIRSGTPITRAIKYSPRALADLKKILSETFVTERWEENRESLNRLKAALKPVITTREEAFDFPELRLDEIGDGKTLKTVILDTESEILIQKCFAKQEELLKALLG